MTNRGELGFVESSALAKGLKAITYICFSPPEYRAKEVNNKYKIAADTTENALRDRLIADYIAGMMDSFAVSTYCKFYGEGAFEGNDLNLPRFIGVRGEEATANIKHLYERYKEKGMVIFYPFFIAEKSGTLNVYKNRVVIEAVNKDLCNLVSHFYVDVTIIKDSVDNSEKIIGDENFLSPNEISEIVSTVPEIKKMFRDFLNEDRSILLEWSFAYNCDVSGAATGKRYLVFYEARVV